MRAEELFTIIQREAEKRGMDWRELEVKYEWLDTYAREVTADVEDMDDCYERSSVNGVSVERDKKTQELVVVVR